MPVRLKVCCISSPAEMRLAVAYGADAVGLVGAMPSGPGVIPDDLIRQIAAATPPPVCPVLLSSEAAPEGVIAHIRRTCATAVQLVRPLAPQLYSAIRQAAPYVRLIQTIHVTGEESIKLAQDYHQIADALLLDSGSLHSAVEELGGTGRTHDWRLSRRIVTDSPCPVFLAGGLNADNVAAAVESVRPFGVDVCSSLRVEGRLDEGRLRALHQNLKRFQ